MDGADRDQMGLPEALDRVRLDGLAAEVDRLRESALKKEEAHRDLLEDLDPGQVDSARNLLHYLGIRRHDIRGLQERLARAGLSSLGRTEAHVLVALDRVAGILALARGGPLPDADDPPRPVGFRQGVKRLAANATELLGPTRPHRRVRIVVTLPTAAADDYGLVRKMLEAGMDCARINTAHDDETAWEAMAENVRRARRDLGVSCRILVDLPGPKLRTGEAVAPGGGKVPRVHVGDRIVVASDDSPDEIMPEGIRMAVPCCPRLLTEVGEGQAVWFDDGRLGGKVACVLGEGIVVEVTHAGPKGVRLKPEKGINFPDTRFGLPALGEQDRRNVFFAARRADVVALSFVNRPSDVDELRDLLEEAGVPRLGILLKIETRSGFELLPRILLAAMKGPSFGVMIARGDLAVEAGFRRLAEVQEEILWVAEAAHAPTVWATQVLEGLAKKGVPSRAEVTDAAMSARAEAVMLNKGPYIVEAIRALDDILGRMEGHQAKKTALLRPLGITRALSDP